MDPDGREIVIPDMVPEAKRRFDIAITELKKIKFANEIITEIETSTQFTLTIIHNNSGKNSYSNGVIYWDSNKILFKKFHESNGKIVYDNIIDPITLLFHEISHGYQDMKNKLTKNPTLLEKEADEDRCIEEYEHYIAEKRGNYERRNHREFMFSTKWTIPEFLEDNKK